MTIAELTEQGKCPDWLRDAATVDADVTFSASGRVQWHRGAFRGGEFRGGDVVAEDCRVTPSRILTLTSVDGWPKTLCAVDGVAWIKAGCHLFTLAQAREHWRDREDRVATRAMLEGIAALAREWGLEDDASSK